MNFRLGQAEAIVARARQQGRVVAEFGAGRPQAAEPPPGQHPCAHSWCILPRNHLGPCQRAPRPKQNKTEANFHRMLEARMARGEFREIAYEPFKMPVEGGMTYCPDFVAIPAGTDGVTIAGLRELFERPAIEANLCALTSVRLEGVCFFETKGAMIWDKNRNKFKQARDRYRWGRFEMWQYKGREWNQIAK